MSATRIALVSVLLALACAKSSHEATRPGGGGSAGGPALTAACAPAAVAPGQGTSTCRAVLTGSSDAISWSLGGPGALSASTGESVQYLPPSQLAADAVAHVVAAAAGLVASFDLQVAASPPPPPPPPAGLAVAGRAVDPLGFPVEGVSVFVAGHPATITAADGTFALSDVAPPYDLVLSTQGEGRTVTVYAGLTRADPLVAIYQAGLAGAGAAARTAAVTGALIGGDGAAASGLDYQGVLVASTQLPAIDPPAAWGGEVAAPPSRYDESPSWSGGEELAAVVLAIQWRLDPSTAAPKGYWLGTADVTLSDARAVEAPEIALGPVPALTAQGSVALPPKHVLERISAQLVPVAGGPAFPLFYDPNADAEAFAYVLPAPEGGALRLCARAVSTDPDHSDVALGCVDATGLPTVEIAVPAAPRPFAPVNGANAVGMDTVFSWQSLAGGVHVLEVRPDEADAPAFLVFTAEAHAVLPSVGPAELALPPGAGYTWLVRGFAPVAGVDALAAPEEARLVLDDPSPRTGASAWGRSGIYHFTVR